MRATTRLLLVLCATANSALGQSTVVVDGGIEFPDGSIQNAAAGVAQTGQTSCFDLSGTADEIECLDSGQDGELRKGHKWLAPRFTINGDGTVTDTFTGLMWLQDANCIASHYPVFDSDGTAGDGNVTWDNALAFVAALNLGTYPSCAAGHDDWRVANFHEMLSLIHHAYVDPALCNTSCSLQWADGDPFTNLDVDTSYWTSTTRPGLATWAMTVDIGDADPSTAIKTGSPPWPVWPVRDAGATAATGVATFVVGTGSVAFSDGGVLDSAAAGASPRVVFRTGQTTCFQTDGSEVSCLGTGHDGELLSGAEWPVPRFPDNADGTVTDNLSGLVWLENADCAGIPGWVDALTFGDVLYDGSTLVGGSDCNLDDGSKQGDWRLPSLWELMSLLDHEYESPALSNTQGDGQWLADDPFKNVLSHLPYWTSTTWTDDPTFAFTVSFGTGTADPTLKTDGTPTALLVRNGQ